MFVKFLKITIALCSFFILMNAIPLYAAGLNFKPQIGIGGDFTKGANVAVSNSTQTIGEYIKQIYKYAIGVVGIVAVVVMMIGGVLWMTAGGNPSQVGSAQQYITGALTGLVLVMFSYVILKTVNPDLVSFKVHTIANVNTQKKTESGCCESSAGGCTMVSDETQCTGNGAAGEWTYFKDYTCGATKCLENPYGCCIQFENDESGAQTQYCKSKRMTDCCTLKGGVDSDSPLCTEAAIYFYKNNNCSAIDGCGSHGSIGSW